jgi:hypothetical protein
MKRLIRYVFKALGILLLTAFTYSLALSALDIYNDFAYDKAILKHTPYGYTPILEDPHDYGSWLSRVKGGDFVYVEDWTSAVNGRVVFAKVKSKLNTGYINQDLLVETNINIIPIVSILLLGIIVVYWSRKLYNLFIHKPITH